MTLPIANAPCSWGVDDPNNPHLPPYATVLQEAGGRLPQHRAGGRGAICRRRARRCAPALEQHRPSLVAGTIFDDLVSEGEH